MTTLALEHRTCERLRFVRGSPVIDTILSINPGFLPVSTWSPSTNFFIVAPKKGYILHLQRYSRFHYNIIELPEALGLVCGIIGVVSHFARCKPGCAPVSSSNFCFDCYPTNRSNGTDLIERKYHHPDLRPDELHILLRVRFQALHKRLSIAHWLTCLD